jgi:hypothetical protein
MLALQQTAHHVRSHSAEADHSEWVSPPWRSDDPIRPDQDLPVAVDADEGVRRMREKQ